MDIEGKDALVLAFPVYGSDIPGNMMRFIKNLPKQKKLIQTSTLCTQALFSGDTDIFMGGYLRKKGYVLSQNLQLSICSNLPIPIFNELLKPLYGKDLENKKKSLLPKIRAFARDIVENNHRIRKLDPSFIFGGMLQRYLFRISKAETYFKFTVVENKCIKCGLCVNNCPVKNIELSKDAIVFHNECICCMRCFNICPVYAINLGQSTKNTKTYRRFLSEKSILK